MNKLLVRFNFLSPKFSCNVSSQLVSCLAAGALAAPEADAEPGYYTQNYWPSVVTPYGSSTCYGCRGKRSAEPGYLGYGNGLGLRSYGYGIGGISTGVGLTGTGVVYESRSAQGLSGRSLY